MKTFTCNTLEDTRALGKRLSAALDTPCLVALYGGLGAGKTALVQGAAYALGAKEVTSPTFNIVHEYQTQPLLYHFDAYRLVDGDALMDIGFDEYLRAPALIFLEWAELVECALPKERINVTVIGSGDEPRQVHIEAKGQRYERMVERLCGSLG